MLLIPMSILHLFGSQLFADVGCDMVLRRNKKQSVGPDGFRFMVIIFESRISLSYFSLFSYFQFLLGFVIISAISCFKSTCSNRLSFLGIFFLILLTCLSLYCPDEVS